MTSSSVYRLDVIEPGRRRRWTVEKLLIVEEITERWGTEYLRGLANAAVLQGPMAGQA